MSAMVDNTGRPPAKRYGFIGLGVMGWGMAKNLRSKIPESSSLYVCEIVQDRLNRWVSEAPGPVCIASSPREISENSDIIITMLPKGPHVWDVFTNPSNGLLSADKSAGGDKLFVECSTIDVKTSLRTAAEVKKSGLGAFVDSPVSGGVYGANNGALSFMIGSESEEVLETVKSVVATMGTPEKIFHCGKPGAGLATKQINNYLASVTMLGVCEAMNMGTLYGLDPEVLARVINVSTGMCYNSREQNPVKGISPISSAASDFEGGFSTELCKGVLDMALELGEQIGAKSVLAKTVSETYSRALESDKCKGKDYRSVYRLFAEDGGRDLD